MARRKQDLAGKIGTGTNPNARPGWRDAISGGQQPEARRPAFMQPEPEPANKLTRKTYLLYKGMIEEIETLADQEHVGINELVRFLLGSALDQVYAGKLVIPTKPGRRRIEP